MKLLKLLVLSTILLVGYTTAQRTQEIFYNSRLFFETLEKDAKVSSADLSKKLIQSFSNDRFFSVEQAEYELFTKPAIEITTDRNDSLEALFHLLTDYKHFDYSGFNQFQQRRVQADHKSAMSLYRHDDRQLYVVEDHVKGKELGDFNFDQNYFTFSLPKGYIAYSSLEDQQDSKQIPENYESNTYRLSFNPINMPQALKIFPKDLTIAENVGQSGFTVKYIFTMTENVNEFDSFRDIPSTILNLFESELYRMGSYGGDWSKWEAYDKLSTEGKIKVFYDFCKANNYSRISPYGRRHYHAIGVELVAIAIESSNLGNILWKSDDWHHAVGASDFENKIAQDIREKTYEELEQLSEVIWELNKTGDLFGPLWLITDRPRSKNPDINTYAFAVIQREKKLINKLKQYNFTITKLDTLADKYLLGLEKHLELNNNFYSELQKEGVRQYSDFRDASISQKYAKDLNLIKKFMTDYLVSWIQINNEYFGPVEVEFGVMIAEHYPEKIELAIPYTRCDFEHADIGLLLEETATQLTVLGLLGAEFPKSPTVTVNDKEFRAGVIIVEIDGQPVQSHCDYYTALMDKSKGDIVTVTYHRASWSSKNQYIQLLVK